MSTTDTTLEIRRFRSGMLRRFGVLYHLSGLSFLLRRLRMDERSVQHIRKANDAGPIVYVFYGRSQLDWLALNQILNRKRLPLAKCTVGLRSLWVRPVASALEQLWGNWKRWTNQISDVESLQETIHTNEASAIFLLRFKGFAVVPTEVLPKLVKIQSGIEQPIQLVPVAVVWQRKPTKVRSETARMLMGSEELPGPLEKIFAVMNRDHEPIVQVGEPVPLPGVLERYHRLTPDRRVRALRLLLRRYLYRESRDIKGSTLRPYSWVRHSVLNSPEIKNLIKQESALTGRSAARIEREVERNLNHIAARFSFRVVSWFAWICQFIWNRIFSGVDIRDVDIERLRNAMRDGTAILVPCHRSHLDYLLISSQCYRLGLVLPYIVAGENLSFFPMGYLFRRSGAFFIKRSFNKERLFPRVFARYVRLLVREEFPIEFFIEGGRSRTGKLLPPKVGMLNMVMDAAADLRPDRKVTVLPIAISYEQIAEEKSYARELSGKKKKKESFSQLLRATSVLKKRFGKVYMRIGEPLMLNETLENLPNHWSELPTDQQKELLFELGERVIYRIGQNMLVLPTGVTALALLSGHQLGMSVDELKARALRYDTLLRKLGAQSVDSMRLGGWSIEQALDRFLKEKWIERIEDERSQVLRILPNMRVTMEYYKNSLIHFVAPISMLSSAILANDGVCHGKVVLNDFLLQCFVLRYEFPGTPMSDLETIAIGARKAMAEYGALQLDGDSYLIDNPDLLLELASLTHNFLESYLWTLKGSYLVRDREISQKNLPKKLQEIGQARIATGELRRTEALSVINLSNAVRAFTEENVFSFRANGGIEFHSTVWEEYVSSFQRLLDIAN